MYFDDFRLPTTIVSRWNLRVCDRATTRCVEAGKRNRQVPPNSISDRESMMKRRLLSRPRQNQRNIIRLFVLADPVGHRTDNNLGDALQRQMAILTHQLDQPLLAELVKFIFRLRHSITVSHQQIAPPELHGRFRKTQIVEQTDHRSAAAQHLRRPIFRNQHRRQVTAVRISKPARRSVIDSQKQSRVLCRRSAFIKLMVQQS